MRLAWRLALGREPAEGELKAALEFFSEQEKRRAAREPGRAPGEFHRVVLTDFCQAVFGMNEFIYVD